MLVKYVAVYKVVWNLAGWYNATAEPENEFWMTFDHKVLLISA